MRKIPRLSYPFDITKSIFVINHLDYHVFINLSKSHSVHQVHILNNVFLCIMWSINIHKILYQSAVSFPHLATLWTLCCGQSKYNVVSLIHPACFLTFMQINYHCDIQVCYDRWKKLEK